MAPHASLLLFLIPTLGFATATPFQIPPSHWKRGGDVAVGNKWLDHDKIAAFPETPSYDIDGEVQMAFKPLLHSWHGCVPYPAVDANGNAGAGLRPKGDAGGDCRDLSQSGQTYTRMGESNGRTGVIYSYYLPKVQGGDQQHKHHWLTAVVWLRVDGCPDMITNFKPAGVSYSKQPQGTFDTSRTDTIFVKLDEGGAVTNPILSYDAGVPLVPSANGVDGALTPPIISWTRLPQLAQEQLNGIQYEHTMVPFNDANFQGTLDAAFNDAFFHDVPLEVDGCGQQDPTEADIDPDVGVPIPSSTPAPDPSA